MLDMRQIYRVVFYGLLITVLLLSLLPVEQPNFSPNDKINHILAYVGLTTAGFLAYRKLLMVAVMIFLFGVLIELLQGLTGYRFLSLYDIFANTSGIVLACAAILLAKVIQLKYIQE